MPKTVYRKNKKVIRIKIKSKNEFYKKIDTIIFSFSMSLFILSCFTSYINSSLTNNYTNISAEAFKNSLSSEIHDVKQTIQHAQKTIEQGSTQIIEHGPRSKKEVALTFDADMTQGMKQALQTGAVETYADSRITDYLIHHNVKATIFMSGLWIETYPKKTKALAANSLFELANHSYSHPSFVGDCFGLSQVPSTQYKYEIERTQQLLHEVANVDNKYFRFPGGCYNDANLDLVKKAGMVTVHWDSIANDGFNTNTQQIINNVLNRTKNGSIIVMHLGGQPNTPKTADALAVIVSRLRENGYRFVTVSELLQPEPVAKKVDLKKYLLSVHLKN